MSESILITYADFADMIEELPLAFRVARRMRGLSLRAAAEASGIAFTTLNRLERGLGDCDTRTIIAILRWLDQTRTDPTTAEATYSLNPQEGS